MHYLKQFQVNVQLIAWGMYCGLRYAMPYALIMGIALIGLWIMGWDTDVLLSLFSLVMVGILRASVMPKHTAYLVVTLAVSILLVKVITFFSVSVSFLTDINPHVQFILSVVTLFPFLATPLPCTYFIISPWFLISLLALIDAPRSLWQVRHVPSWICRIIQLYYFAFLVGWLGILVSSFTPIPLQLMALVVWLLYNTTLYILGIHEQEQAFYEV